MESISDSIWERALITLKFHKVIPIEAMVEEISVQNSPMYSNSWKNTQSERFLFCNLQGKFESQS